MRSIGYTVPKVREVLAGQQEMTNMYADRDPLLEVGRQLDACADILQKMRAQVTRWAATAQGGSDAGVNHVSR